MTDQENAPIDEANLSAETAVDEEALNDAERVVAAFGGVRPMAARLDLAATTIQGWKSRGNIPENRRQAVREAALADGIDLTAVQHKDDSTAVEDVDDAALNSTESQQPDSSRGNSVAWFALAVAAFAGIAAVTQPKWAPALYGAPTAVTDHRVESRIAALENKPSVPDLSRRVATVEQALNKVQARAPVAAPVSAPNLTPQLNALRARLDNMNQTLGAARTESRTAINDKGAELTALRASLEALTAKVERTVVDTVASNTRRSSLIVAVGALEVALRDGSPYGFALDAIKRQMEAGNKQLSAPLAVLAPHASAGILTQPELARRLSNLVSARGKQLWSTDGEGWVRRALRKIDSVVTVRRVDDANGGGIELVHAEQALASGDFSGAVAKLKGASGPAGDWVREAQKRLAADNALVKLRVMAIERPMAAKTPAQ